MSDKLQILIAALLAIIAGCLLFGSYSVLHITALGISATIVISIYALCIFIFGSIIWFGVSGILESIRNSNYVSVAGSLVVGLIGPILFYNFVLLRCYFL